MVQVAEMQAMQVSKKIAPDLPELTPQAELALFPGTPVLRVSALGSGVGLGEWWRRSRSPSRDRRL